MSDKASKTRIDIFENSLSELESLVEQLEKGDLSLEDSLKQFERGISLARECQKALKAAELKVSQLMEGKDGPVLENFDSQDEPA